MAIRAALVFIIVFLSGCATSLAYSDGANAQERKSYINCAVTRAFVNAEQETSSQEAVRAAIGQCKTERRALYAQLITENAGKPFAMNFVDAYMDRLHATMLEHITLRLEQSRSQKHRDTRT